MLTLQGVKKPVFHAYRILNGLGKEELCRGEGYIFTRKNQRLAGAFYNYPETYTGTVPMSVYPDQTAARECQNSGEKRPFDFTITGLRPGDTYLLRILRSKDIAVGLWNRMEAPVSPTREQTEHLRRQGEVMEEIPVKAENSGSLHLSFLLDPWSIAEIG